VSLAIDGVLRHVPNPDVFVRLFAGALDPNAMTRYDSVPPMAEGQPLSMSAKLIRSSDAPEVYLLDDQAGALVRRHLVSAEMFNMLGFDWGKIEVQAPGAVNQIPLGRPCSFEKPDPYREWEKQMQALGASRHPGDKVSIEFRDKGATVDAQCWYGDGNHTPSDGGILGTYTKPQ
jgi:hypothetical protein